MPITSILELTLRPEAVADSEESIGRVLRDTRAFDGCLGLELLRDREDPAHVVVVEHWASIERDDAYRAWRATPDGESGLGDLVASPPVLTRCEVVVRS